jgi:hypothetical protein
MIGTDDWNPGDDKFLSDWNLDGRVASIIHHSREKMSKETK